jgi:hypothetical protein
MKKLALMALAAGMVVGGTGIASAQYYDPAYRNYPRIGLGVSPLAE